MSAAVDALPEDRVIITDGNVWSAWGSAFSGERVLVLPPGEQSKSMRTYDEALRWVASSGASRRSAIVAFGGGVIGDLAGFVAASYLRGVPLVQLPTTLLAQVDSSVGGKVGIDLPEGKNLVGAFWPPTAVSICLETLRTLDHRQLNNGLAEVWKYGFIMDPGLLELLPPETERLESIVKRCIELKARIVQEDEFETLGLRAILNFGHTLGHAIEQITGYGPILHGEAIAIGMAFEARLGERLGITRTGVAESVRQGLVSQGLPTDSDCLERADDLVAAMRRDKKASASGLAFSLLPEIGECKLIRDVPENEVRACLKER